MLFAGPVAEEKKRTVKNMMLSLVLTLVAEVLVLHEVGGPLLADDDVGPCNSLCSQPVVDPDLAAPADQLGDIVWCDRGEDVPEVLPLHLAIHRPLIWYEEVEQPAHHGVVPVVLDAQLRPVGHILCSDVVEPECSLLPGDDILDVAQRTVLELWEIKVLKDS